LAVKIRLKRMGKKKQPFYRIVVADSRSPRDGRSIETLGHYNPLPESEELVIKEDRLFHWLSQGADPSDTVKSLLRNRGLTLKYDLIRRNADEATISKELNKWEMAREDRAKRLAAAKEAKVEEAPAPVEEPVEEATAGEEPAAEEVATPEVELEPESTEAEAEEGAPAETPEPEAGEDSEKAEPETA